MTPTATGTTGRISAAVLARRLGPDNADGPHYRRLADRIRSATVDGRLGSGLYLPSERELAHQLSLSRTTVAAAYAMLRDDGWVTSHRGAGSRIQVPRGETTWGTAFFGATGRPRSSPAVIDLTVASIAAPAQPLLAATRAATEVLPRYFGADSYFPFGVPALRDAIAQHYTASGLPTSPEEILVTSGAQHSLSLCQQVLSSPGDRILLECPTYPVALDAIRAAHRIPSPLPLSDNPCQTWDTDLMAAVVKQAAPRLAYLIPDFQNPTGALMAAQVREQVVSIARRSGMTIVVDESFRDLPFDQQILPPPMVAYADSASVICLGSVSKLIWGGLRVGWVRAAPALVERLALARSLGDMCGPVLDQLIVTELLADPKPIVQQQVSRLQAGATAVLSALAQWVPHWRPMPPAGGATVWVRLPGPYATELARLAPAAGVRVVPGPRFGPDGTMESHLRLPFTAPPADLYTAVQRLAGIDEQAAGHAPNTLPGWLT